MYDTRDTIAAIATAPGYAARAIIRVSGHQVVPIVERLFRATDRRALGEVKSPTVIPGILAVAGTRVEMPADVYLWPSSRSYTREPLAELHVVGSPPLVEALLATLCQRGARVAAPGEFTLRAFLAGRLDLAQAEAVMGVVDARSSQELSRSLAQLAGGIARPLTTIREALIELLAELEAGLDFVEEDIAFISREELLKSLNATAESLERIEAQWTSRGRSDTLPRAALVGLPNVGKSSLFNALADGEHALVSAQPGTTRDYLAAALDLGGMRCQLVDTAGAERGADTISEAAQQATSDIARASEIRLLCIDASRPLVDWEQRELAAGCAADRIVVLTKCDRPRQAVLPCPALQTSAATGSGLDDVRQAIAAALAEHQRAADEACPAAQQCLASVRAARSAIERAGSLALSDGGEELVAGEVRVALAELGHVTGKVYTEDLLARVFSRFCIGK